MKTGFIKLDELQIINHENNIKEISIKLKKLAKELNLVVIISLEISSDIDRRPNISAFKEDEEIIEVEDIVMLLDRDNKNSNKTNILEVQLIDKENKDINII